MVVVSGVVEGVEGVEGRRGGGEGSVKYDYAGRWSGG